MSSENQIKLCLMFAFMDIKKYRQISPLFEEKGFT